MEKKKYDRLRISVDTCDQGPEEFFEMEDQYSFGCGLMFAPETVDRENDIGGNVVWNREIVDAMSEAQIEHEIETTEKYLERLRQMKKQIAEKANPSHDPNGIKGSV